MIDIYKMKLHERYSLSDTVGIMRVAGGWLYSNPVGNVFVPYHNEFQGINKQKEYKNIDDIAIVEVSKWRKELEKIDFSKLYREWIHDRVVQYVTCGEEIKSVIEELIKDNEWKEHEKNIYKSETKKWKDYCNELKNKLQQKQPPKECIKWLEEINKDTNKTTQLLHCDAYYSNKLLKYFKEMK